MGNHDHMLNKYQFRSAKEEGKEASDWLSTHEGHRWQSKAFDNHVASSEGGTPFPIDEDRMDVNAATAGLFNTKTNPVEMSGPAEIFPDDFHKYEGHYDELPGHAWMMAKDMGMIPEGMLWKGYKPR